jgi:rod shape-determining protein MreC
MTKKRLIIFALFLLLVFGLLTFQSIKGESHFINFPLNPLIIVEKGTSAIIHKVSNFFNTYIMIFGKERENRELHEQIDKLTQEKNEFLEDRNENERLRKILKLKKASTDYVVTARVFARDPTNWFQSLWINKGMSSGIAKNMVAMTTIGPVGKVHRVFQEGSNIILITDINSSVAVRLQTSRIEGILEGRGDNSCNLKYISKMADVKVGERLITSGLDGLYPAGLLIGHVTSVKQEGEEMFQVIEVEPAQNLNTLEEVIILKR